MATHTAIGTRAITTHTRARNILVNNDGFTKHATTGRTTAVMRTTRRATFRYNRVLNNGTVKVNHIDLVNYVAIDTPYVWERTGNDRIGVIEFDSIF
jgi:hypothetical protein